MKHLVLLLAAVALGCQCAASSGARNLENWSNNPNVDEINESAERNGLKNFVRIVARPTTVVHHSGRPVEISCEAMGSPAPTIKWLRNNQPILEHDRSMKTIYSSGSSVARLNSTLIVKPTSPSIQVYTCLATSARNTAAASITVYSTGQNSDLSEREALYPLQPHIVATYKILMDTIGQDVVLPCQVKGHPRPKIRWWDNNEKPVRNTERMKILRSGALSISQLQWADMGEFTCKAYNRFGADTATTYVYPVAASI